MKKHIRPILLTLLCCCALCGPAARSHIAFAQAPSTDPSFADIDAIMAGALSAHELPGAVIEVGHAGKVVFRKAYGDRSLEPTREPISPELMTADTVFDMASLTKPMITALAAMQLVEQGKLRLEDPVAHYIPEFAAAGKGEITVRQLLTHYSGLPPDLDLRSEWSGKAEGFARANAVAPQSPPGAVFRYSDINFIVVQEIVEKLSGMPLNTYAQRHILGPLGMAHSGFLPSSAELSQIAPTEYDENGKMLRGVVHDPTARRMGGVAGDAGLFSTADDVAKYAGALLNRLLGKPSTFPLRRATLLKMTTPEQPPNATQLRGYGWDIDSAYSGNRGELFAIGSFGHTGFTGTSLWMDPASDTYVVILANSVHPHAGHNITPLRGRIATAVAAALDLYATPSSRQFALTGYNEAIAGQRLVGNRNGNVFTGIDVLKAEHFAQLRPLLQKHGGKLRLGLVTNQTGLDREDRRTIDVLKAATSELPGLTLTTLFSPEHGIHGTADTTDIRNDTDAGSGLPVVSLYGATDADRRPKAEQLRELDAVVFDLQDAGVRFYTYETLLGYFLEAAAKTGTNIIVLDRPDPITGSSVQGPVSDPGTESYTNYTSLPVRHGMTLGELARYDNGERNLHAPLTVIAMKGWQRGDWFDATGLVWTDPSPNLRSVTAAALYPGLGLLETTNLSVGRGTDTPFERIGAPWIDPLAFAAHMNARLIAGVRFVPVRFTPQGNYPYSGMVCGGVDILITDRAVLDAPELGVELAAALHAIYGAQFGLAKMGRALLNSKTLDALTAGTDPRRIADEWRESLQSFEARRQPYLLY